MRLLSPLRDGAVALLWGALSLSALGDQLYTVALTWIAVQVFGAAAGYLNALGAACVLLTALLAGHWADGWEQRRAMIGADLVRAAVLAVVVAAWAAIGHPPATGLIIAVAVLAGGQAVFRPALQRLLPALTPDREMLPAANALFDATDRIARLLGPGLVGLLAAFLPAMHFLSLDAASFVLSAAALLAIGRLRALPALRRAGVDGRGLRGIGRGFAVLHRHRLLGFCLWTGGVVIGTWFAAFFLALPLLIARHGIEGPGGSGLGAYGLVLSAYGCTNLLSNLAIGGRQLPAHPAPLIFTGTVVLGTGTLVVALAAALPVPPGWLLPALVLGAGVSAIGGPMEDIPLAVLRQTELPLGDVPAAMRAVLVVNNAGLLVAMAVAPPLLQMLPLGVVVAGCALAMIAVGVAGFIRFAGSAAQTAAP
ncbi:MAG TPA: MFS transporter [Acetobacteraceae bacterium]|nr:MFS transporter [Acetobacteraceae bacterium]